MPPWRRAIANLCLVGIFVGAVWVPLHRGPAPESRLSQADEFAALEAHFFPLLAQLPPSTRLGYVSEHDEWSYEWMREFFKTQFILAPRVVQFDGSPSTLVANFQGDRALHAWLFRHQTDIARAIEFGQGLALVEMRRE